MTTGSESIRENQITSRTAGVLTRLRSAGRATDDHPRESDRGGGGGDGEWEDHSADTVPSRRRVYGLWSGGVHSGNYLP